MSKRLIWEVLNQDFQSLQDLKEVLGDLSIEEHALLDQPGLHDDPTDEELAALGPQFYQRVASRALRNLRVQTGIPPRSLYLMKEGLRLLGLLTELDLEDGAANSEHARSGSHGAKGRHLETKKAELAQGLVELWQELRTGSPPATARRPAPVASTRGE